MITETHYLYSDRKDVTLTTYLLTPSEEIGQKQERPLVLICPGGGYLYCSDREAEPMAHTFNAMGYHAAVLRYSTYFEDRKKVNLDRPLEPDTNKLFPAPMIEIAQSIELIHSYSNEWNVDTQSVGLCGFSAGAHNVCMYATHWHKPIIQQATQLKGDALKPAFLISAYGLLDIEHAMKEAYRSGDEEKIKLTNNLLTVTLGTATVSDDELKDLSPIYAVDSKTPPSFIWTTSDDTLVDAQDSVAFAMGLAHEKIPFEMHVYESGVHGLSAGNYASANRVKQIHWQAHQWVHEVERWLANQLPMEKFLLDE
ncbi:alpha/beta hydrolase [Aerococcaceae bacterium DSM 111020]|nr:alpha/beta hydrolase [Aerococcaceae bacterium DSM 111020]